MSIERGKTDDDGEAYISCDEVWNVGPFWLKNPIICLYPIDRGFTHYGQQLSAGSNVLWCSEFGEHTDTLVIDFNDPDFYNKLKEIAS